MHAVEGVYSMRLSRWLEFFRGWRDGESRDQVYPKRAHRSAIAALIGTPEGTKVLDGFDHFTILNGRLSRTFPKGSRTFPEGGVVTPGNGLFLTSVMTPHWRDTTTPGSADGASASRGDTNEPARLGMSLALTAAPTER